MQQGGAILTTSNAYLEITAALESFEGGGGGEGGEEIDVG